MTFYNKENAMVFDVYVQDSFYKAIEGSNVADVLKQVSQDMVNNLIPNFDPAKNHDVRIVPQDNA
jgi:hypothetical protein